MHSSGFTLIELMVTLAIALILLTLAAPSLQTLLANQRLSASASSFMSTVMQARSTALQYNQRVIAQPLDGSSSNAGTWSSGWRVYRDIDKNSTFDDGTVTLVLTQEELPKDITIDKFSGTNNFFGYDGSGFLARINGSANSTWKISSTATTRVKYLIIENSGRARLCDPMLVSPCP